MKTGWCRKWKTGRKIYYFDSEKGFETEEFAWMLHELIEEVMAEAGKEIGRAHV